MSVDMSNDLAYDMKLRQLLAAASLLRGVRQAVSQLCRQHDGRQRPDLPMSASLTLPQPDWQGEAMSRASGPRQGDSCCAACVDPDLHFSPEGAAPIVGRVYLSRFANGLISWPTATGTEIVTFSAKLPSPSRIVREADRRGFAVYKVDGAAP